MANRGERGTAALIDRLAGEMEERLGADKRAGERFLRLLYANVPPEDVSAAEPEALLGGARSLWRFLQTRRPGRPRIRVFNPTPRKDGWQSAHTVIEVVNDDMPFLVDSTTAELNRHGLTVHIVIHPILRVRRDRRGRLIELYEPDQAPVDAAAESVMHIEINEQTLPETLKTIKDGLMSVLADVRATVEDWRAMRVRVADLVAELDSSPPPVPQPEIEEAKAFLRWIDDNNFTFLGCRAYRLGHQGGGTAVEVVPRSGLGLLRSDDVSVVEGMDDRVVLPPEAADFLGKPTLMLFNKATRRSTVHRAVHLDTISVKSFDAKGAVVGATLFAGLYASSVYTQSVRQIPVLRRRVDAVVRRSGFPPASHDGKALAHILETMPRDDLLQMSEEELFDIALGIVHLQERQRVKLFARHDPFGRYVSCLVYVPRERYTTAIRHRMHHIIEDGYDGTVTAYFVQVSESVLARLQFIVKIRPGQSFPRTEEQIESDLVEAGRDWPDDLSHALVAAHGEGRGLELYRVYAEAFPVGYRERHRPGHAVHDIAKVEEARKSGRLAMSLYHRAEDPADQISFKIFNPGSPLPLSDVLPVLENLGLRVIAEVPERVRPEDESEDRVWIHDLAMVARGGAPVDVAAVRDEFEEAFARIWAREAENDGFNRLVVAAGLSWRQVVLLRACAKYLRQTGIPFSPAYMDETLALHGDIAYALVGLFEARFDPDRTGDREADVAARTAAIAEAIEAVSNPDEDRILRRFLNLLCSMLRTNYFQIEADGRPKPYLSFKLDSRALEELPLPRPFVEVFVYSPRFEAIHLRGGKVARGGIRWSDRREDFRTEILSLMKAQMTKNAVIVPVGAKGGFVVKRPPDGNREALMQEGVACYRMFMHGLLDITDNRTPERLVPPERVVRRDDDDPYLVVAADKGTATFSDIANDIAREHGFWLDDAFASGGSAGYDHKKMGITARGAWVSVQRHFREMGRDVQSTPFTVVGIGDMSGDVFGNGMLRSDRTRLLGAFNHLHIFVDPDPDPAASFKERQRLFSLPRSSWSDYDPQLLSKGGAVYERSAKRVRLTPQIKALLGLGADSITPNELIRALLRAEVDLLWFGGIGTYVKASDESHAEVGDRTNDNLRVDAKALRCKVIAEGANLGVTQRGRIEYALAGGRINTDAIDNSAGVDTSDHEVNIKILLGEVIAGGDLTLQSRDKLLFAMTDDVAEHVLLDNYRQTMALSNAEAEASRRLDEYARFIRRLEREGRLDRGIEFLPDEETIAERRSAGVGLTRPELAVLLSYAKIALFDSLVASDVPDDPFLVEDLGLYFPEALRERYGAFVPRHRLRREISATYLTNSLLNRAGATFVAEMQTASGAGAPDIARAYLAVRQSFALRRLWAEIESLDGVTPAAVQTEMQLRIGGLIRRGTLWFLRNMRRPLDIQAAIADIRPGIATLEGELQSVIGEELRETIARDAARLVERGAPRSLAEAVASLDTLFCGCDIVRIARGGREEVSDVARAYFTLGAQFGLDWLRRQAEGLATETEWQRMAVGAIVEELYAQQRAMTTNVIDAAGGTEASEAVLEAWRTAHAASVQRVQSLLSEFRAAPSLDLAMLAVANREIRALNGA